MSGDANQLALPLDELHTAAAKMAAPSRRTQLGQSSVAYVDAKSILTESSGFINAYDYTLNPYSGCTFGCSYCYAAFFVHDREERDEWGRWVKVKQNALDLPRHRRRKPLRDATIYMSSVTDPYCAASAAGTKRPIGARWQCYATCCLMWPRARRASRLCKPLARATMHAALRTHKPSPDVKRGSDDA